MSYYKTHIFFCTNLRGGEKKSCEQAHASDICKYTKKRVKKEGLSGKGGIRVNKSGCLGRCKLGPCLVIYPEGIWYTYKDTNDIDEIVEQHLIQGLRVERLLIPDNVK